MKTLNHGQISHIATFLAVQYDLKYEVRDEILDHIACEIEERMEAEHLTFEESFQWSIRKWHFHLRPSKLRAYAGIPNYMAQAWFRLDRKIYLLLIVLTTTVSFGIDYLGIKGESLSILSLGTSCFGFGINILLLYGTKVGSGYKMQYLRNQSRVFFVVTILSLCVNLVQYNSLINTRYEFSVYALFFASLNILLVMLYQMRMWLGIELTDRLNKIQK